MKCAQCKCPDTKVLESRESRDGTTMRRRRECMQCGWRFTTFERAEESPIFVVKRNGGKELFDRAKLMRSMSVACQKRKMDPHELERIANWVERTAQGLDEREITSQRIGELVLEILAKLDPVAYIRFASVYKSFENPKDFMAELLQLEDKRTQGAMPPDFGKES